MTIINSNTNKWADVDTLIGGIIYEDNMPAHTKIVTN